MLSERRQSGKATYCMISFIRNVQNRDNPSRDKCRPVIAQD
jgi:hypothetical protein